MIKLRWVHDHLKIKYIFTCRAICLKYDITRWRSFYFGLVQWTNMKVDVPMALSTLSWSHFPKPTTREGLEYGTILPSGNSII